MLSKFDAAVASRRHTRKLNKEKKLIGVNVNHGQENGVQETNCMFAKHGWFTFPYVIVIEWC